MGTVAELWRHPIKSHGREALTQANFTAGKCMPWDRHWAVTHEKTKFDGTGWVMCRNFMIGAMTPSLLGIWAKLDEATGEITLRHQDIGEVTFNPDEDEQTFLKWVAPLCPPDRMTPTAIVKAPERGMTDSDFASVSIMNRASHDAVEAALAAPLEMERWRANIWVDGVAAWDEMSWIGKTIRIGQAEFEVRENCKRCKVTETNPVTGERDVETLSVLNTSFGHQNFGMYAYVTKGGPVALGDQVEVL